MFGWLLGRKRRDERIVLDLMRAAAEGDRLHRLRQAIATISAKPVSGKDATEQAASAAAMLTTAIVNEANTILETDDDLFVAEFLHSCSRTTLPCN
jgi:hypothetical protein